MTRLPGVNAAVGDSLMPADSLVAKPKNSFTESKIPPFAVAVAVKTRTVPSKTATRVFRTFSSLNGRLFLDIFSSSRLRRRIQNKGDLPAATRSGVELEQTIIG